MRGKSLGSPNILFVAIGLVLLTGLVGCAPCSWFNRGNNNVIRKGTVTGTCFIATDAGKSSVPNVTVTIGSRKMQTDSKGFFRMTGLAPGPYAVRVAGGDLGYTGKVNVAAGKTTNLGDVLLHATLPPPNTTGGTTGSTAYPTTAEDVIRAYYKALNDQDYAAALNYLGGQMGGQEVDSIRVSIEPYVKSVQVAKIERKTSMDYSGWSVYVVTFTAEYFQPYPAGNGDLPTVHALQQIDDQWKIVDIST